MKILITILCFFAFITGYSQVSKNTVEYPKLSFSVNKVLANKSLLFVLHDQYPSSHHNTETIFQKGEEVNQDRWNLFSKNSHLVRADYDENGKVKNVEFLVSVPDGVVRDPCVSFDGKRALFSMRKNFDDSYNIYEIDFATKKVTQLTRMAEVSDIDPTYLPSGEIVFASTRAAKYCGCNRHIMANLYRMNADGTNITQIGNSIEFENTPSVMADGRILYTRWEYVDRNFSGAQGLWTCNPDGTRHALYWGQETKNAALQGVEISSGKVIAILSSCHDKPWGALAIIDRNIDVEGEKSVVKIFPEYARKFIDKKGDTWGDAMRGVAQKYAYPMPLNDKLALVSKEIAPKARSLELLLINLENGKEEALVRVQDKKLGVCDAQLIQARKLPQTIPEQRGYASKQGTVYVANVYEGTHMRGIKHGDIKYLRVIENPPKTNWTSGAWDAEGTQAPAMNYDDYDNKIIYGIVPVESDGSAYFAVPSDKFFYLQALDKDKKMLQTMRSGVVALPDEIVSCAGCHESRKSPPPISSKASKALRRGLSKYIKAPYTDKLFSYTENVQPIFDKHCMPCHDFGGKGSKKIILAGDRGLVFNKSYAELHSKRAINAIGAGPDKVVDANTWGAKHSKIIQKIEAGHSNVKLSPEEIDTLCAWIDLNAPYYHSDDSVFPNNPGGRSPLTSEEIVKLFELCGKKGILQIKKDAKDPSKTRIINIIFLEMYPNELVSFNRPEKSEVLKGLDIKSKNYKEALKIIELGATRLKMTPRPDMKGFKPTEIAIKRKCKFDKILVEESLNRKAITEGKKRSDPETLR